MTKVPLAMRAAKLRGVTLSGYTLPRRTLLDDMTDTERKAVPLAALFDYFPDALIEAAQVIADGQRQHGTVGWDRNKSNDHRNTLLRHFLQAGTKDKDGRHHSAKIVIRALMALQIEIEAEREPRTGRSGPSATRTPKRRKTRRTAG